MTAAILSLLMALSDSDRACVRKPAQAALTDATCWLGLYKAVRLQERSHPSAEVRRACRRACAAYRNPLPFWPWAAEPPEIDFLAETHHDARHAKACEDAGVWLSTFCDGQPRYAGHSEAKVYATRLYVDALLEEGVSRWRVRWLLTRGAYKTAVFRQKNKGKEAQWQNYYP